MAHWRRAGYHLRPEVETELSMAKQTYDDILKQAQELSKAEQIKLVDELAQHTARKNGNKTRSILELEGLGKEIWKGVDPDEYVAKERDSWDG